MSTPAPPPSRGRTLLWQLPALAAAVLIVVIAGAALLRTPASLEPQAHSWWPGAIHRLLLPAPNNNILVSAVFLLIPLVFWLRMVTGADERLRPAHWAGTAALATVVLGVASYAPCSGEESLANVLSGTLALFEGEVHEEIFRSSGACPGPLPLAIQVARVFGPSTPLLAVFAALVFFLGTRADAWWTIRAHDVDVVVGLDPASKALLHALVRARQTRRGRGWDGRLGAGHRRSWRGGVVLIHPNADDPDVAEVRQMGVRVLIGDPLHERTLARALTHDRGSQVSVRRFFAVTASQSTNIALVDAARRVLGGAVPPQGGNARSVVPRLVARFTDPREAHDWRVAQVGARDSFVDTVSSDGLLARQIVAKAEACGCTRVVLEGDSAMAVEILDQIIIQRSLAVERSRALAAHRHAVSPDDGGAFGICNVSITGPNSRRMLEEWQVHCPPGVSDLPALAVNAAHDDVEDVVAEGCPDGGRTVVIVTGGWEASGEARSVRISRMYPGVIVVTPGETTIGLAMEDAEDWPARGVVRYGPTLTEGRWVPSDSWTLLARQNHEVYVAGRADGRMARRPWGSPADEPEERLPRFYREDNLRQLRGLLSEVMSLGYDWLPVSASSAEMEGPAPEETDLLARREHERWCALRRACGWRWVAPPPDTLGPPEQLARAQADELACRNPNLVDWESGGAEGLREFNRDLVRQSLGRLRAWGIAPQRRYERSGTVTARQVTEPLEWSVPAGDTFVAAVGDWVVTDASGSERVVKAAEFNHMHEPTDQPGRYRRLGRVHAGHILNTTTVRSLEDVQVARAGDWLVTDERGNSWPVPDAHFRATYTPVAHGSQLSCQAGSSTPALSSPV